MSAGQQVIGIHVGDRARAGNVQVAADQNCADGRTGLNRFGLLLIRGRAANAHHRRDSCGFELWSEALNRLLVESVENERRLDGSEILRVTRYITLIAAY